MYEDSTGIPSPQTLPSLPPPEPTLSPLYINVDVNDLLDSMTPEQMFELLGKLKDLFDA